MRQFHLVYPVFLGLILLFSLESNAFAHGDDAPGPHGGVIRMPGAFHTEIVSLDKRKVVIYLLDIQFKEPITEKSSVNVSILQESKTMPLQCKTEKDRFICTTPSGITLDTGTLDVVAKRREVQGVAVKYPLPIPGKS